MTTFDPRFARLLLEICRYTYAAAFDSASNAADRQSALDSIGQSTAPEALVMLDDGRRPSTSVACVAAYPDRNVVAYMGTKTEFRTLDEIVATIRDWKQNIEALLVPFRLPADALGQAGAALVDLGGRVHHGFLDELRAVHARVVAELLDRGGRDRPVVVTGHSQGGAEAALATRALVAAGFTVEATYTFAAPRPGDRAFADSVETAVPVHRIEFGNDIVPHVPPTLASRQVQAIVEELLHLPLLPDPVEAVLTLLKGTTAANSFTGVGRLCYGSNDTRTLRVGLSADEESGLFGQRLRKLAIHPKDWAEHHHLAGTKDEVEAGRRGNYTALVSEFPVTG